MFDNIQKNIHQFNNQLLQLFITLLLVILSSSTYGQRLHDDQSIGWYSTHVDVDFKKKWGFHIEYNLRRTNIITDGMQNLLRMGINKKINDKVAFRVGYAWAENFPYGDYPLNAFGKDFTEHRMYEMATINDKIGKLELSHRFMLEQRWIGRYSNASLTKEDAWTYLNRVRYQLRLQYPFKKTATQQSFPYVATYDELIVGFGGEINENILDQNRLGILVGYRFNKMARIEGGYINQILQLPREINNRNVYQHNNGIIVNLFFNLSLKPTNT